MGSYFSVIENSGYFIIKVAEGYSASLIFPCILRWIINHHL